MKKLLILIATVMLGLTLAAEEIKKRTARMDVSSKTVTLTPKANCRKASWGKNKYLISSSKKLSDEEWIDYEIEFVPESDGEVILSIRGMHYRPKGAEKILPVWVYFDDIEVAGADLLNGGFEEVKDNGKLANWSFSLKENIVNDAQIAKSGGKCVKVWHNKAGRQKLKVKKGQPVRITAKVKAVAK